MRKLAFSDYARNALKKLYLKEGFIGNSKLKTVLDRDELLSHKKIKRVPISSCNEGK
jgi:hypothetical protein